eukprot:CAMPEP_0118632692 /NCGR_PEP_ID=MMETSP0785-20121206/585_1 /TAXON_ID=91992 /ORGANISM="Bolidomonas pacifica, Strain CCMP 1866" /LENGTH=151 /DNA_ID=CAMNT_0006523489 /DNA_START=129 /DNA_END=581 /DNA_ORIENTATION=+
MSKVVSTSDIPIKPVSQLVPKLQKNHLSDAEPTASAYMDAMRKLTDPESHVKTIEEELQETVAAALGKSGAKVLNAIKECEAMKEKIENDEGGATDENIAAYEELRKKAYHFRWELTIHRQACGFVSGNYKLIEELYVIPPRIDKVNEVVK